MRNPQSQPTLPRRKRASGVRPIEREAEVTRVDAPAARDHEPEAPTIRRAPKPPPSQHTMPAAGPFERRALPFARPEGQRGGDEPSIEVEHVDTTMPPSSESPWSQHCEIDREALPSSLMPPLTEDEVDEEGRRRARRAAVVVWIAVATVAAIALLAMWWAG